MRNAGVWTYGIVNLTHILGVASLFGAVLVLDLRLLGLWRSVPLSAITRPTVPIATAGFVVAATSGLCLITTNGSEYVGNPFLLIKFPAILLGLINVGILSRVPAWNARNTRALTDRRTTAAGHVRSRLTSVVADGHQRRSDDRVLVAALDGAAVSCGGLKLLCPTLGGSPRAGEWTAALARDGPVKVTRIYTGPDGKTKVERSRFRSSLAMPAAKRRPRFQSRACSFGTRHLPTISTGIRRRAGRSW